MTEKYFFDTYAIFEMMQGNRNYDSYKESSMVLTIFNLVEFNYNLKKEKTSKESDKITENYSHFAVKILLSDIFEATELKKKNRHFSLPDVIGYTVAKRLNIRFLTGDKEFENLPNVEFVK